MIGNLVLIYANIVGTIHRVVLRLVQHALFSPIYWGFMSIAAWKGFWQLIVNPFYWEKTEHGLDTSHHETPATTPQVGAGKSS